MANQTVATIERPAVDAQVLPFRSSRPAIRTAGVDMSLRATGVALSSGECRLFGEDKLTTLPWGVRIPKLTALALQIGGYAAGFKPDAVCIEGLDMAQSYGGQIERSYMWCLIIDVLLTDRIPVYIAPSPQLKIYATGTGQLGSGAVAKSRMIKAVREQWPFFKIDRPNGQADHNLAEAAVCCAIAAAMLEHPFTGVDRQQSRALARVTPCWSLEPDPA